MCMLVSRMAAVAIGLIPLFALAGGLEAGRTEVVGYAGGVTATNGGSSTRGSVGGGLGAALSNNVLVFGEFTYIPITSQTIVGREPGATLTFSGKESAKLLEFGGGLQYSFAGRNPKLVPYVVGGAGVGRGSASGTVTVLVGGRRFTESFDETDTRLGVSGGLGLRYHITSRWGLRPEIKVGRSFGGGGDDNVTIIRYTVGVFYQFGK